MDELFNPRPGLPDAEVARRCKGSAAFDKLAELLGDDIRAVKAMREESKFVQAHPELPRGAEFAAGVRGYLVANKLEWTQENLQKAVETELLWKLS
jgi:hypothetical protein